MSKTDHYVLQSKTDEEYRLLAKESKEKFDELESKINEYKQEDHELKVSIMVAYSFVRKLDDLLEYIQIESEDPDIDQATILNLVSWIRSELSDLRDKYLTKPPDDDDSA